MSENSSSTELGGEAGTSTTIGQAPKTLRAPKAAKDISKSNTTLSGEKVRIKIPETREETQKGPVFVGINGDGYQIPRGVEVIVPREVVEVLNNAIEKSYDATDGKQVIETEMPRHSYQFLGTVSAKEAKEAEQA